MHDAEVDVLIVAGCSLEIIEHCMAVSTMALSIAGRVRVLVDRELVRRGGLFHDIGRSRTQGIGHAVAGAELVKNLGFPDVVIHIIERHIGAGITAGEAERLGLPKKDYLPMTAEEKIVSYADNLHSGVRVMLFSEALDRFRSILGPEHEGLELFEKQHREIQGWMK